MNDRFVAVVPEACVVVATAPPATVAVNVEPPAPLVPLIDIEIALPVALG